MESGRRAVDSYWRSRMIDAATSDEDKVTPVYKLEEICDLLRSSHVSIVKEVSEFILKRLEHKSPVVKQKALRLIKYAVVKSGVEFKKEMQRNSTAIRQLFHYKGQPDPLKGDALNKAVRDTAHETISTIFSADDNKPLPSENLNKRIEGFGNTNYEMPSQDKKTFLSEVVGLGSASIKQGFSSFTQAHSFKKTDRGDYKGPNLQRSLTTETEYGDRYEPVAYPNEIQSQGYAGVSKNMKYVDWNQDSRVHKIDLTNADSSSSFSESKTREERLLEMIANSGGVRLQPTRDAIQSFLVEAAKLDALALSRAIELKLKSPSWQVRMKAVCVLESIVRKYDDGHFSIVVSYFSDNQETVVKCAESPQASLREKANKVLYLLNRDQAGPVNSSEMSLNSSAGNIIHMPDLIDTGDSDGTSGISEYANQENDQNSSNSKSPTNLVDDLFSDGAISGIDSTEPKLDDPFSDVSFHTNGNKAQLDDIFSGLNVDGKTNVSESHLAGIKSETPVYDIFGSNLELTQPPHKGTEIDSLVSGLSVGDDASKMSESGNSPMTESETTLSDASRLPGFQTSKEVFNGIFSPQMAEMNANTMFPNANTMFPSAMPYNISPGMILNPAYASQPINGPMSSLFAQQQFLATMSNLQHFRNLNPQMNGTNHMSGAGGGYSSPIPDIFQSNFSVQNPSTMMNGSKREETKAFDFISDHLAAARDSKR